MQTTTETSQAGLNFDEFVTARRRKYATNCRTALAAAQRHTPLFGPHRGEQGAFSVDEAAELAAIIDAGERGELSGWQRVDGLGAHAEWWCNLVDCSQGSEDRRERHRATVCREVKGLLQPDLLAGWGWFAGIDGAHV
jgi:hypothetical protein